MRTRVYTAVVAHAALYCRPSTRARVYALYACRRKCDAVARDRRGWISRSTNFRGTSSGYWLDFEKLDLACRAFFNNKLRSTKPWGGSGSGAGRGREGRIDGDAMMHRSAKLCEVVAGWQYRHVIARRDDFVHASNRMSRVSEIRSALHFLATHM